MSETPRTDYYSVLYSGALMAVIGIADFFMGNAAGGSAFLAFAAVLFLLRWRLVRRSR